MYWRYFSFYPTALNSKNKLSLLKQLEALQYNSYSFSFILQSVNLPLYVLHTAIRVHIAVTVTIILDMMHAFTIALTSTERKFDDATTSINDCSCHTELVLSTKQHMNDCNQITDYINNL